MVSVILQIRTLQHPAQVYTTLNDVEDCQIPQQTWFNKYGSEMDTSRKPPKERQVIRKRHHLTENDSEKKKTGKLAKRQIPGLVI